MKQLKQFKRGGIQARKQVINYFLTFHVGTTNTDLYGNRYCVLKGYCNGVLVISLSADCNSAEGVIYNALRRLNLPTRDYALLEVGVHLTVHRFTVKHRELKNYSDWCLL